MIEKTVPFAIGGKSQGRMMSARKKRDNANLRLKNCASPSPIEYWKTIDSTRNATVFSMAVWVYPAFGPDHKIAL
jgi:hypothetical protein